MSYSRLTRKEARDAIADGATVFILRMASGIGPELASGDPAIFYAELSARYAASDDGDSGFLVNEEGELFFVGVSADYRSPREIALRSGWIRNRTGMMRELIDAGL